MQQGDSATSPGRELYWPWGLTGGWGGVVGVCGGGRGPERWGLGGSTVWSVGGEVLVGRREMQRGW